jgi:hypothetical protein
MSNLKNIKKLEKLYNETKNYSEENAKKAFKILEKMPEVLKVLEDLESMQNGKYSFDECGELVYTVEVPNEIADLPFINDFLTRDFGFLTGKKHNDLRLGQFCGPCITIDWNHGRNSYFIYDHETRKPVIEKREEYMTLEYVSAVIELYQNKQGVFNDIVEIDSYYGFYNKHFSGSKIKNLKHAERIIKNAKSEVSHA